MIEPWRKTLHLTRVLIRLLSKLKYAESNLNGGLKVYHFSRGSASWACCQGCYNAYQQSPEFGVEVCLRNRFNEWHYRLLRRCCCGSVSVADQNLPFLHTHCGGLRSKLALVKNSIQSQVPHHKTVCPGCSLCVPVVRKLCPAARGCKLAMAQLFVIWRTSSLI